MVSTDPIEDLQCLFGTTCRLALVLEMRSHDGYRSCGGFWHREFHDQNSAATAADLTRNPLHECEICSLAPPGFEFRDFLFLTGVPVVTNRKRPQRCFDNRISAQHRCTVHPEV